MADDTELVRAAKRVLGDFDAYCGWWDADGAYIPKSWEATGDPELERGWKRQQVRWQSFAELRAALPAERAERRAEKQWGRRGYDFESMGTWGPTRRDPSQAVREQAAGNVSGPS